MRELLKTVFDNFANDYQSSFGSSKPTYRALSSITDWINENIKKDRDDLVVKFSAGKGNWTQVPHFSILNTKEAKSTQDGIYIVGLFQHSMEGVYLCIGQGVTGPKELFGKKQGSEYLLNQANLIKDHLDILREKSFEFEKPVELKSTAGVSVNYPEAVCVHYYINKDDIPSDDELKNLFEIMIKGYDNILANGISSNLKLNKQKDLQSKVTKKNLFEDDVNQTITKDKNNDRLSIWENTFFDYGTFQILQNNLLTNKNLIIQGAPGVGKTFIGKMLAESLIYYSSSELSTKKGEILNLVLHENFSYEEFIMGIRPDDDGNFKLTNGIFYNFVNKALNTPEENFVVILDEMNRANITKIFGELMVLIEHDKRGEKHSIKLMYSGENFFLPENLYIIGLMNTADRSLKFIDYALRRRFNFFTFHPSFEDPAFKDFLIKRGVEEKVVDKIILNLSKVNQKISDDSFNLGPGYCIGHSYFCPPIAGDGIYNNDWFLNIINHQITPLIEEYYADNPDSAAELIDDLTA